MEPNFFQQGGGYQFPWLYLLSIALMPTPPLAAIIAWATALEGVSAAAFKRATPF
jgi:hypothetical protein